MPTVFVPTQLRSYTGGKSEVAVGGETLTEALKDLDARFPGIVFRVVDEQNRIREHMRIFVDGERVRAVEGPVRAEIHIFGALSGG